MKHVTIVVPEGDVNLNTVSGAYEILTGADVYWQKMGNPSMLEAHIAGFVSEVRIQQDYFAIYPGDIRKIKKNRSVDHSISNGRSGKSGGKK